MRNTLWFGLVVAVLGSGIYVMLPAEVVAQSGTRIYQRRRVAPPPEPFERTFWNYLQGVSYRNWAPWPGQDGDFFNGQKPHGDKSHGDKSHGDKSHGDKSHGDKLKIYVNRPVASNPTDLPVGSIIIQESYSANEVAAITVMYRSEGFSKETKDWYWIQYTPDGAVTVDGDTKLAGKVDSCVTCHRTAAGEDYIFSNDK